MIISIQEEFFAIFILSYNDYFNVWVLHFCIFLILLQNTLCNFSVTYQWAGDVTGNVPMLCDITMAPKQKQQMQKRSEHGE